MPVVSKISRFLSVIVRISFPQAIGSDFLLIWWLVTESNRVRFVFLRTGQAFVFPSFWRSTQRSETKSHFLFPREMKSAGRFTLQGTPSLLGGTMIFTRRRPATLLNRSRTNAVSISLLPKCGRAGSAFLRFSRLHNFARLLLPPRWCWRQRCPTNLLRETADSSDCLSRRASDGV